MKNIANELNVIKATKCIDQTLTNANIILPTVYTTQELGVSNNFYINKTCSIDVLIPAGTYKILSNTASTVVIDYAEIVFKLGIVQPEPPAEPLPDVFFKSNITFTINFNSLSFSNNVLVSDRKVIIDADVIVTTIFKITANTHNTITVTVVPLLPNSFIVPLTNIIIQKSLTFEAFLDNFIGLMNTPNTRIFTRFECPTNNDFFLNYEEFTDIMIGYKTTYKDEEQINTVVGLLNEFIDINITGMSSQLELTPYYNNTISKINLIYTHIDSWIAYFARLKKLMSKMRISDAKIAEEEMQNLYDAKTPDSQIVIDALYDKYETLGQEAYIQYKQELTYNIKID